jgi:3-deoxy-D-manno-octulosonate 8-phosphate phosphatase (KDO 8-P phosphatase)
MSILEKFEPIRCFVFDVDGVLTDGMLLVMPGGLMARRMNIKDGYALQLAIKKGYDVVVISGGHSPEVQERLALLGVQSVHMSVKDKKAVLEQHLDQKKWQAEQILYMGDDIPDYEVMQMAGLRCCPADAATEIQQLAQYVSPWKGGEGCARDVIEKVLKLNDDWELQSNIASK